MKTFLLFAPLIFTKELEVEVEINDKCTVNGTTYFGGSGSDDKQKSNFVEDSFCFTTKTTEITKDSFTTKTSYSFPTNTNYYKNSSIKDDDYLFFTFFSFFMFFL
jgi:hypothetical protein